MTLDKYLCFFFIAEVCWTYFYIPLYRCEFTFPSAWGLFITLLVWKGFYVCQKKEPFYIKNKQASPAQI